MPTHKITPQYGTLDVLLMLLLSQTRKTIQIPVEIFKKHSLFFAKHRTVSVSVQWPEGEAVRTGTVTLKCTDKSKLRRLIDRFLSLYRKNKITSKGKLLGCQKADVLIWRFVFMRGHKRNITSFEFTRAGVSADPSMASVYSMDTAAFMLSCSYSGYPIKGIAGTNAKGKWYAIVEVDGSALWPNVVTIQNWRVRVGSPNASYQGHQIQFDRSSDKQKRLLDMLVSSKNGVVKTDKVISELKVDNTNRHGKEDREFALERIREWGREIRKKVKRACRKDGYGDANFHIEVGKDRIRLVDTSPV